MTGPRYVGETDGKTWWKITVYGDGDPHPLDPCLHLAGHSPDGFAWSYAGSGPHQASIALLTHALGEADPTGALAKRYKGDFVHAVLAQIPTGEGFEITADKIRTWVGARQRVDGI